VSLDGSATASLDQITWTPGRRAAARSSAGTVAAAGRNGRLWQKRAVGCPRSGDRPSRVHRACCRKPGCSDRVAPCRPSRVGRQAQRCGGADLDVAVAAVPGAGGGAGVVCEAVHLGSGFVLRDLGVAGRPGRPAAVAAGLVPLSSTGSGLDTGMWCMRGDRGGRQLLGLARPPRRVGDEQFGGTRAAGVGVRVRSSAVFGAGAPWRAGQLSRSII
jgi:hypothetical protein